VRNEYIDVSEGCESSVVGDMETRQADAHT